MIILKSVLFALILFVALPSLHGNAEHSSLSFHPYNRHALVELKKLKMVSRSQQVELLRKHQTLTATSLLSTQPPFEPVTEEIFAASIPTFSWISENYRVECASVVYADRSAKYLIRQFKGLRERALDLLNQKPPDDQSYNATVDEIVTLLNLVESAYPPSFSLVDRRARYILTPSSQLEARMTDPHVRPYGTMRVTAIKFGEDGWLRLRAGLEGLPNFNGGPRVDHDQIILDRDLSPMEACLQNVELSVAGDMSISISRPFIETPPYRVVLPGRRIIRS